MSRDHAKLRAFTLADSLVEDVFAARLGFLPGQDVSMLDKKCGELLRTMQRLIDALERRP